MHKEFTYKIKKQCKKHSRLKVCENIRNARLKLELSVYAVKFVSIQIHEIDQNRLKFNKTRELQCQQKVKNGRKFKVAFTSSVGSSRET